MSLQVIIVFAIFLQAAMAGISVTSRNGVTDIYINNRKVQLNQAKKIEVTPEYTVYQPAEDKDVRIIIDKNGGLMITRNGSTQIIMNNFNTGGVYSSVSSGRPMTPEERETFQREMARLNENMKHLHQRLGNLGSEINNQVQQSLANAFSSNADSFFGGNF